MTDILEISATSMTVIVTEQQITVISLAEQGPAGIAGIAGATGATGAAGPTGATGPGVANGGNNGQFLRKNSNTNYDTTWSNLDLTDITSGATANQILFGNSSASISQDNNLNWDSTNKRLGIGKYPDGPQLHIKTSAAMHQALAMESHASQSANITEWRNSSGAVQMAIAANGRDFVLDATSGTKIGTTTSQKLAFYNSTPIMQPSGSIVTALSNLGLIASPSITLSSDVSGTLPISHGGTGATTARAAQAALKGVYILAASAVASALTGSTSETTLATVTIPANAMGENGIIRITSGWSHTNSANNKALRIKFGGTTYGIANITTNASSRDQRQIANRGTTNSQVGMTSTFGGFSASGVAPITSSVDTTQATTILFTGQLNNADENITLEYYLIELIIP